MQGVLVEKPRYVVLYMQSVLVEKPRTRGCRGRGTHGLAVADNVILVTSDASSLSVLTLWKESTTSQGHFAHIVCGNPCGLERAVAQPGSGETNLQTYIW